MRKLTTWLVRVAAAGVASGGLIAACHETPSTPVTPVPREAPPLGDRPKINPGVQGTAPGQVVPVPAQSCADGANCPDAGVPTTHPGPVTSLEALGAQPASAQTVPSPTTPTPSSGPVDAGVDAPSDLPPELPDAGAVLKDAAQPMQ